MPIKIAQITDLHLDEDYPYNNPQKTRERFDRVFDEISKLDVAHIVCTGDIGENRGVQYFFDKLKDFSLAISPGNHDQFQEISKYYQEYANHESKRIYGSTEIQNNKVIYLDSSVGFIDEEQLLWLQKELAVEMSVIVFMHHPIIRVKYKVDEIGQLKNREEVMAIFKQSHNQINVYCGHYHMASELVEENVIQNITPAISYQIKEHLDTIEIDTTVSGYRIIELGEKLHSSQIYLLNNAV